MRIKCIVGVTATLVILLHAPATDAQTAGTARIRGHVVAAESGRPLRHAEVRLSAIEMRISRLMTSDADGRYELADLPAGRYTITTSKGGYIVMTFGQRRPTDGGRPIEILDAQTIEKVDFALLAGAVVAGRVVDEYGDPVSDAYVAAMQQRSHGGTRRLIQARGAMSNDIGEFRVFGLAPGQYYLSVRPRNNGNYPPDMKERPAYAPTFFPAAARLSEAQRLSLGAGQTITDVVIALTPARLARVSGTVTDSQGRPMPGGGVVMMPKDAMDGGINSLGGAIRPDGTFVIESVAPGAYTLRIDDTSDYASADLTVTGDDLADVRLVRTAPLSVTGRVIIDPAASASFRPSLFQIGVTSAPPDEMSFGPSNPPARVKDDFTFETKTPPGNVRVFALGLPAGWTIHAVRHRGGDVMDRGIDVKPGENLTDVEVELTNRTATIGGGVTDSHGAAVKDYSALVFTQDRERWTFGSRYVKSARPDQDGHFKVTGLLAGHYYVVALEDVDSRDVTDPELLDRLLQKATRVSVNDGETKTVDLKLVSAS